VAVIARIAPRAVLIIGGTSDHSVPAASLERLYEAARGPKAIWMVDGAGHGNYHAAAPLEYSTRLNEFFRSNLRSR
jgi:fermentation-respiration switch protein FrsA (DUF1100 family)